MPRMRGWLTTPGSLTARLIAHSRQFRVQKLRQAPNLCLADEAAAIGLARRSACGSAKCCCAATASRSCSAIPWCR